MTQYLGDFPTSGAVSFLWNTNAVAGESITRSTDGTLKIFKSNATASTWATERSSLAGVTQLEDFDSTGIHSVYIDLSDNTDAGFYAAGNEYQVAITGATIDGKTINAVLASFSIERANGILALLKHATYGLSALETLVDDVETRLGTPSDLGGGASLAQNLADIEAQTDDIGVAGAGLTNIGTIATVTNLTNLPAAAATAAELAKVPKSDGAVSWNATALAAIQSEANDALVAYDPPTNAEMEARTIASANYALEATLTAMKGATYAEATDSLEALRNRGDAAWVTATGFATPTNITAGTITTVTNLTNLPAAAALEATLTAMKGATFNGTTDSLEAIRDRGDAAWTTATGFSTLTANDVNAEVVDALATDTYAEPTGVPGATIALSAKIGWLYRTLRNALTVSGTKKQFADDSGTVDWEKDLSDDGSTYTETEGNAP